MLCTRLAALAATVATLASASEVIAQLEATPPVLPSHRLLIVAPNEFLTAVEPLRLHKVATGMPTQIIALETILASFSGVDHAARLKAGIFYYHQQSGTDFVMLVGDSDKIPVRYIAEMLEYGQVIKRVLFGNSDLYYADLYATVWPGVTLFSDWNNDAIGIKGVYFGQLHKTGPVNVDRIDFFPDIAVGRVPASTVAEVTTYVNKVIRYETGSTPEKRAAVVAVRSPGSSVAEAEAVAAAFTAEKYDVARLYDWDWLPYPGAVRANKNNLLAELNTGVRFLSVMSHGNPSAWGGEGTPDLFFENSDLPQVTNQDRLPIILAGGCDTARFAPKQGSDYYYTESGMGVHNRGTGGVHVHGQPSSDQDMTELNYVGRGMDLPDKPPATLSDLTIAKSAIAMGNILPDPSAPEVVSEVVLAAERVLTDKSVLLEVFGEPGMSRLAWLDLWNHSRPHVATGRLSGSVTEEIALVTKSPTMVQRLEVFSPNLATHSFNTLASRALGYDVSDVATGDVDADGRDEIIVAGMYGTDLVLTIYRLSGSYLEQVEAYSDKNRAPRIALGHLSGGARDEIVVAATDGANKLALFVYAFEPALPPGTRIQRIGDLRIQGTEYALAVGQLDADSAEEFALSHLDASGAVVVRAFDFAATAGLISESARSLPAASLGPASIAAGGMDSDGRDEVVVAFTGPGGRGVIQVYDLDTSSTLKKIGDERIPEFSYAGAVAAGNCDGDVAGAEVATFFAYDPLRPTPPDPIQPSSIDAANESFAEELLVKRESGAIIYIGSNTGAQSWNLELFLPFFDAYLKDGKKTVGKMWMAMVTDYYTHHDRFPTGIEAVCGPSESCWMNQAELFQAARHNLFGDPSLRIP